MKQRDTEEITFNEWKKKYPHNYYVKTKTIVSNNTFQNLRREFYELTQHGDCEAVYELAQMEGCCTDDIYELIGY